MYLSKRNFHLEFFPRSIDKGLILSPHPSINAKLSLGGGQELVVHIFANVGEVVFSSDRFSNGITRTSINTY